MIKTIIGWWQRFSRLPLITIYSRPSSSPSLQIWHVYMSNAQTREKRNATPRQLEVQKAEVRLWATASLSTGSAGGEEEEQEGWTDLKVREVVGPLLCSNTGKVPLYPGDVSVSLWVWGRGCDGRERLMFYRHHGWYLHLLSSPMVRNTHSQRGGEEKLKVVMVATPVTGNLSFLRLFTSSFFKLISLPCCF